MCLHNLLHCVALTAHLAAGSMHWQSASSRTACQQDVWTLFCLILQAHSCDLRLQARGCLAGPRRTQPRWRRRMSAVCRNTCSCTKASPGVHTPMRLRLAVVLWIPGSVSSPQLRQISSHVAESTWEPARTPKDCMLQCMCTSSGSPFPPAQNYKKPSLLAPLRLWTNAGGWQLQATSASPSSAQLSSPSCTRQPSGAPLPRVERSLSGVLAWQSPAAACCSPCAMSAHHRASITSTSAICIHNCDSAYF